MSDIPIEKSLLEGPDLRPPPASDAFPISGPRGLKIGFSRPMPPPIHPIQWWAAAAGIAGLAIAALAFLFNILTRYGILP